MSTHRNFKPIFGAYVCCLFIIISCGGGGGGGDAGGGDENRNSTDPLAKFILTATVSDTFTSINNRLVTPSPGNVFLPYLVSVTNNADFTILSSADTSAYFALISDSGFVFPAENTSSAAWRENRPVWSSGDIPPGETRQGWIIFNVPPDIVPQTLIYDVLERTGPGRARTVGTLSLPLD